MDWTDVFRKPLLSLNFPDGWAVQFGPDEAYRMEKGTWRELDSFDVEGRMLDENEIKVVPKIGKLLIVVYFIPRMDIEVSGKVEGRLKRHFTVTMRPYYHADSEEDAVSIFWREYGRVVGKLEKIGFLLRDQDVDRLDKEDDYDYFVDTSFWKFPESTDAAEILKEFLDVANMLYTTNFDDDEDEDPEN